MSDGPIYHGWTQEPSRMRKLFLRLPDDLQNEARERRIDGLHHDDCKCQLDDYFEIRHCNCGLDDLLDKLDEHGYTDVELERLFPDGYIY